MDVDVIARIAPDQVSSLVSLLEAEYYIDAQMIIDAISSASSFNLIHLETMIKIDVFTQKREPYHESALERRLRDLLVTGDQDSAFYFSSPEDIILSKLRWYEMGDRVSERQWLDVVGVVKVQGNSLNTDYLIHWSKTLDLFDLLKQAFLDAGINF